MQVNFSFQQVLSTYHPDLETTIAFHGAAIIIDDDVLIASVCSTLCFPDSPLRLPAGYEAQNLATGQMGEFLGMCREAARKAAYKIQKAEQAESDAKFEASRPNNGGFMPSASDTSYMNQED